MQCPVGVKGETPCVNSYGVLPDAETRRFGGFASARLDGVISKIKNSHAICTDKNPEETDAVRGQAGWQTADSGKGKRIHSCFSEKGQAGQRTERSKPQKTAGKTEYGTLMHLIM